MAKSRRGRMVVEKREKNFLKQKLSRCLPHRWILLRQKSMKCRTCYLCIVQFWQCGEKMAACAVSSDPGLRSAIMPSGRKPKGYGPRLRLG